MILNETTKWLSADFLTKYYFTAQIIEKNINGVY